MKNTIDLVKNELNKINDEINKYERKLDINQSDDNYYDTINILKDLSAKKLEYIEFLKRESIIETILNNILISDSNNTHCSPNCIYLLSFKSSEHCSLFCKKVVLDERLSDCYLLKPIKN